MAWTGAAVDGSVPGRCDGTPLLAPRYWHRDREAIYGDVVRKRIASIGMKEVVSAKRSSWQNPYAERVIGSIRRECTDHSIPLNETHLRKILGGLHNEYRRAG